MLFERRPAGPLAIGPVTLAVTGGVHRLTAEVCGVPVWIESSDTPLRKSPEAFGSAFILPSQHHGRPLALADPVDEVWLSNTDRLQRIFHDWWRYRVQAVRATPAAAASGEPSGATALFFSGGADSFYSLLRGGAEPDRLVVIHGFDIPLEDTSRMASVLTLARSVAAERGLRLVVVGTNLREHPLIARTPWERAHGGVMMAVGHALGDGVAEVLVSSSVASTRQRGWGSHWQSDPLHSSASRRFRQLGMELRRVEKLRLIASEPIVQRHLRVCWQNRTATPNCQRCQKCILTRLVLADCGVLDRYSLLDGSAKLAQDTDRLDRYRTQLRGLGEVAASPKLEPAIRLAAERLLKRSRHANRPWVRAVRALRRRIGV